MPEGYVGGGFDYLRQLIYYEYVDQNFTVMRTIENGEDDFGTAHIGVRENGDLLVVGSERWSDEFNYVELWAKGVENEVYRDTETAWAQSTMAAVGEKGFWLFSTDQQLLDGPAEPSDKQFRVREFDLQGNILCDMSINTGSEGAGVFMIGDGYFVAWPGPSAEPHLYKFRGN